jgi:hypothetical protein
MLPVALHSSSAHSVPTGQIWQPPLPSHLPLLPHDAVPWSTQVAIGSTLPAGTFVHAPGERAHDWHLPSQAELQQTPWAQKVLAHSLLLEQAAPFTLRPHELLLQLLGGLH